MTEGNIALWGWDGTKWVKLAVTGAGALVIDMAGISLNDIGNINAPAPNDGDALVWDDATSLWIPAAAVAAAHAASHQAGGADEINVGALDGVLADPQVPIGHHTLHEEGNADALASAIAIAAMANLTSTKIWQGNAGNRPVEVAMPAAGEAATKEFFVPAHCGIAEGLFSREVNWPVIRLISSGQEAYVTFPIPADFSSITTAVFLVLPQVSQAAANWDIHSHYAAAGEAYDTHSESDEATTYNVTENQLFEVDASGILSAVAVGDYVGIRFRLSDSAHDVDVIGLRFKYA